MKIGLIVDHPKRDLSGLTLVAREIVRRSATAYLIPLYEQAVDIPLLGLDAVVVNYARPANLELLRAYAEMGISVFVLDTEGGVLSESGANAPMRLARFIRDSGLKDWLSGYLFWGERLFEAFAATSGMPPNKLCVTGCPRYDLCSRELRPILSFPHHDYVLINTSFPLVNPRFTASPQKERDTLVAAGWDGEYVDSLLSDLRSTFPRFMEEVARLAAAFRDTQFLIRPHPFELQKTYRSLNRSPNIFVDGRGNVLNAINNARCVLHVNCGTGIEATMLERLPISLTYLTTKQIMRHSPLPFDVSLKARSFDEVSYALRHLDECHREHDFAGNYLRYIKPWFFTLDGYAASRVAEFVVKNTGSRKASRSSVSLDRSLRASRSKSRPMQVAQAALYNLLGSRTGSLIRCVLSSARQDKRLGRFVVRTELDRISRITGPPIPHVVHERHPLTGLPMASIRLETS